MRDAHVFSFVWLYRQANESLGLFVWATVALVFVRACQNFHSQMDQAAKGTTAEDAAAPPAPLILAAAEKPASPSNI